MKKSEIFTPNEEQKKALLSEAKNVLVLGGGGFGKTSLLAMKAEKLTKEKSCLTAEILVLTDTELAADKLKALASKFDIKISTLYKYALDIIRTCEGKAPKICKKSFTEFAFEEIKKLDKNPKYHSLIAEFASNNGAQNDYDYEKYLAQNPPTTYAGERVKSMGEVEIADFLYMAKIKYEYERAYEKDTRTEKYGQYYPDFYLPDKKIYIEYFGVDREGKVPSYFRGENPSEEYGAKMKWKKELHAALGTKLIDLYAYQHFEGTLIPELESRLSAFGVKIRTKKRTDFTKNMTLHKAAENITSRSLCENSDPKMRELSEYIAEKYREYIEKSGGIELSDVISRAAEYVSSGKYRHGFKYIFADEFERFSKEKRDFLFSFAESERANLFCVGEDSSEFAACFKKAYPDSDIIELKKSYRLPTELVKMLKAELVGGKCENFVCGNAPLDFIESHTRAGIVKKLSEQLDMLPRGSTVLVCMREGALLGDKYESKYDAGSKAIKLNYLLRPDLKIIFFETKKVGVHSADYVFAECTGKDAERAFLYAAACRAKKKIWFMMLSGNMPEYVEKIKKHLGRTDGKKAFVCPRCGGNLIKIKGKYGEFIGCSNYASKKCTYRIPLKRG